MLARQLKLRLVADEASGIPRSCTNVIVSIHAIATFQAFNDYLRPRIIAATGSADRSGAGGRSAGGVGGRLSGFLDAFAAASAGSASPQPSGSANASTPAVMIKKEDEEREAPEASTSTRKSRRLSTKTSDEVLGNPAATASTPDA